MKHEENILVRYFPCIAQIEMATKKCKQMPAAIPPLVTSTVFLCVMR